MKKQLSALAFVALAGCAEFPKDFSAPKNEYFGPIPIANVTPTDPALECLSNSPQVQGNRSVFAVHVVQDLTQWINVDEVGGYVPSDAASMLVTALEKAGLRQVNRINTAVSEFELALAQQQILGDGTTRVEGETVPFRPVRRGALRGSQFVIDGAITQLDFNTYSEGGEAGFFGVSAGRRVVALTVGADLRVTNTVSTEIVKSESYAKQAVGREVFGSIFRFFDEELFDVNVGRENFGGLQASVRWLMAEAAYDIVADTLNHDGSCDALLPENLAATEGGAERLRQAIEALQ